MAKKRMFSLQVIDTDAFLEMPGTSQNLYFHLGMRADDDGFIDSPKKIMKIVNCSDDDMKILLAKRFIIGFESGIIVIKHWRMLNYIAKDRYVKTAYLEEFNQLEIKENGSYTECIQNVDNCATQISIDKININKINKDKEKVKKPVKIKYRENVKLLESEYITLIDKQGEENTVIILDYLSLYKNTSGKTYKSDYGAVNLWVIDALKQKGKIKYQKVHNTITISGVN